MGRSDKFERLKSNAVLTINPLEGRSVVWWWTRRGEVMPLAAVGHVVFRLALPLCRLVQATLNATSVFWAGIEVIACRFPAMPFTRRHFGFSSCTLRHLIPCCRKSPFSTQRSDLIASTLGSGSNV